MYGRRGVLILSIVGAAFGYVSADCCCIRSCHLYYIYNSKIHNKGLAGIAAVMGSPWLLLLSRLPVGLAKQTATISRSIVADVTTPAERSSHMSRLTSTFGLGPAVGPFLGACVSYYSGSESMPAVAASAIFIAVVLPIIVFLLPETRTATQKTIGTKGGGALPRLQL